MKDLQHNEIKKYNLFADYPNALTPEEKEIIDIENLYWHDFFIDKCND